jgi:peptide/nickel transport system ATP-binding protein
MTSLNPVMRCGRQVKEVITKHLGLKGKAAKREALRWFGEVSLPRPEKICTAYPHQLSGGQKQRVMIAMAMACRPRILIADEPTTALDVTVQQSILLLMQSLQQKYGTAIVFITHDLGVISSIAHEIMVLRGGKTVETGKPESIFHHPDHPYTKGLIQCRPDKGRPQERLPVIADFLDGNRQHPEPGRPVLWPEKQGIQSSPVLELNSISTWFRQGGGRKNIIKAVDGVSLEVFPRETLGLVGESGSGKTTLGRPVLKLVPIQKGQIRYRGEDIYGKAFRMGKFRKSVQIIFQDPYATLNPRMSIGAAIEEPLKVHRLYRSKKERRERVYELLEKVGLESGYYPRYPHALSGGQRQRVGIARALAVEPEFIICDESVSALDVSVQAQVLNLLNDLKEEFGFTFIFISHDLAVVRHMSDRIAVMKEGKIVELERAEKLFKKPSTGYTKQLLKAIPTIK